VVNEAYYIGIQKDACVELEACKRVRELEAEVASLKAPDSTAMRIGRTLIAR
jgi:hypothetical protein